MQGLELAEAESRKLRVECALAKSGQCATIGAEIESNAVNGAESCLRLLIYYAGIANRLLFDLALFDVVSCGGIVCDPRERAVASASSSEQRTVESSRYDDRPCADRDGSRQP